MYTLLYFDEHFVVISLEYLAKLRKESSLIRSIESEYLEYVELVILFPANNSQHLVKVWKTFANYIASTVSRKVTRALPQH